MAYRRKFSDMSTGHSPGWLAMMRRPMSGTGSSKQSGPGRGSQWLIGSINVSSLSLICNNTVRLIKSALVLMAATN